MGGTQKTDTVKALDPRASLGWGLRGWIHMGGSQRWARAGGRSRRWARAGPYHGGGLTPPLQSWPLDRAGEPRLGTDHGFVNNFIREKLFGGFQVFGGELL